MSRLADYFVVVGFDHSKERSGSSSGVIVQRFPLKDWPDTPFIEGIEWFCQPQGWALSTERQEPRFFVSVLTDIDANRHYCACMCFNETVSITPSKPVDEEEDPVDGVVALVRPIPAISHHSIMYAPKCLVLVSRLDYIDTFRNCLGVIYTAYIENMGVPLETLVGNILGCIHVPPPGGPQVRFSIGAGDRQSLQPPISPSLPVTHASVNLLFQQLGIRNVLVLFCAIITEHKILFHSKSYNRLTEACRALTALMYPFRYSHVYIPLLPAALIEVLCTPTPFIMGVHSSLKGEVAELMDVIFADLDGGSIIVPDGISLPLLPEPLLTQMQDALSMILQPELTCADYAFPPLVVRAPQPQMLDKEIRAVFMRAFAQLLQGYRSCLTLIRIHPRPVITFHKAQFLGERNLKDCDFSTRVLDCMFFTSFVAERGPPWRACDVWDELYSNLPELLKMEAQDSRLLLVHIQELAQQLYTNENPNPQSYAQKIPVPPDGAFARIHQPPLPSINPKLVETIIEDGLSKNDLKSSGDYAWLQSLRPIHPRIVPTGPHITNLNEHKNLLSNSARRLEVLRNCVNCIFENKIADARKTFPAVLRALQSKAARLALCNELAQHVIGNKAILEHQQFDLVVRLMNCALQDDSTMDEHGVAAALLPLATAFCRKLCTGVIQFAYTCIQEHAVWQNQQFWEASFYQDVQKDIKALYLPRMDTISPRLGLDHHTHHLSLSPTSPRESKDFSSGTWQNRRSILNRVHEPSALEIAAEQMRICATVPADKQMELQTSEESTLYSQAIHYANRMVSLLIPLDVASRSHRQEHAYPDDERASNSIANSVAESDSADAESGFEDQDPGETGQSVIRSVTRFIDKVCNEGGVNRDHIRNLHQMVPGVVHIHIETLEGVHRESKRLPPIQKPKILTPNLLPGEEPILEGLRVYLLPDGREESSANNLGGPPLLPAEGAIFLTNYRIIFKGTPCDSFACEEVVVRSFPVTSLTKEKKVAVQYLAHLDQWLQEGLQLRSCAFQLLKLAFDEEVTPESIEILRKQIHKLRHPPDVFHHFAFAGQMVVSQTPLHKTNEKHATLRGFAKKTLMKTAIKAGFKQKSSSKRQKYVLPIMGQNSNANKYMTSPGRMSLPTPEDFPEDDVSMDGFEATLAAAMPPPAQTDAKTLERLAERSYVRDWQRLGLCTGRTSSVTTSPSHIGSSGPSSLSYPFSGKQGANVSDNQFRLTSVNSVYMMCRSYPALIIVPSSTSDESVRRFCRCYRQSRIPCVTWRHNRTRALLLRGAGHHGKSVMGMLKGHPGTHTTSTETTSSTEHEKYLSSLVSLTPSYVMRKNTWGLSDSSLSIDSLLLATDDFTSTLTPELVRKSNNPFNKAMGTLGMFPRSSGGKGAKTFVSRWGSLKDKRHNSQSSLSNVSTVAHQQQQSGGRLPGGRHSGGVPTVNISIVNGGEHVAQSQQQQQQQQNSSMDGTSVHTLQRAALYVLGEKAHMKGMKLAAESAPKTDFIPVEYFDVRQTKTAFKKLMRACVPSTHTVEPEQSFHKLVENSEWLQQLQNIMQLSGAVVDLLDLQGSSVAICLEDGWDITAQVSSIAQLCLDPHYRTIEGFRVLIEKEWIGFGHRFRHRSNLNTNPQSSGFAPTFLQFLDVVHQIQRQFPMEFEFNDYYLRFLAYHSVSCRFRTFLFDGELERVESGVAAVEDKRGSLTSHHKSVETVSDDEGVYPGSGVARIISGIGNISGLGVGAGLSGASSAGNMNLGQSVFDYIERQHTRSPLFFNFLFMPDYDHVVLRPQSHLPCLEVWNYYMDEELCHGPSYDPEIVQMDCQQEEENEAADGIEQNSRKTVTMGYNCISKCVPDAFTQCLEDIHRLETELGHLPQKWKVLWDKLDVPNTESMARNASFSTALVRSHGRLVHKRSTLEILMRGKMVGAAETASSSVVGGASSSTFVYSHPHRFERYNFTTPTYCDLCANVLWGPVKIGMRCMDCGYGAHEKCLDNVPKNCTKYKSVADGTNVAATTGLNNSGSSGVGSGPGGLSISGGGMGVGVNASGQAIGSSGGDTGSVSSGSARQTSSQQFYAQFSSNVAENRTHEGYLFKRGALLKGWKQRWFVLDSIKHQLRYYDAMEDSHYKGLIELAEVMSVAPAPPAPGPPKKTDDKSFFDLRTCRRTYNFCASDAISAQEWIEKLQACLQ